nr:hypothetical protein [Pandoravirus massiliensis]
MKEIWGRGLKEKKRQQKGQGDGARLEARRNGRHFFPGSHQVRRASVLTTNCTVFPPLFLVLSLFLPAFGHAFRLLFVQRLAPLSRQKALAYRVDPPINRVCPQHGQ